MLYSTDRILTTHAGSLPRPLDLKNFASKQPLMARALCTAQLQVGFLESKRRSPISCGGTTGRAISDGKRGKPQAP